MRVFIVEDEPPAAERLTEFLKREPGIEIVGMATSGVDAVHRINDLAPDLIFMDIHLGDISGLDLLKLINTDPAVIFTTAYDQYAVRAFDLNAVDYLLKPYDHPRLIQAVQRARHRQSAVMDKPTPDQLKDLLRAWPRSGGFLTRIPSKRGEKIDLLADDDIVFFASDNKLVFGHLVATRHLLNYTLDELQGRLDLEKFYRVHRSTIVNLNYVKTIETWFKGGYRLTVKDWDETQLAVSRSGGKLLRRALGW